jgi:hypothetical protein
MIRDVVGRREYSPIFLNEDGRLDSIHPMVFVEFFVFGLKAFQIILHDTTSFTFMAMVGHERVRSDIISDIRDRLDDLLTTKRMRNVNYKIAITEQFSADKVTGKFQLIKAG